MSESTSGLVELDMLTMSDPQILVLSRMSVDWGYPMRDIASDTGVPEMQCLSIARQFRDMGLARIGPWYDEDSETLKGRGYSLNANGDDAQMQISKLRALTPLPSPTEETGS